MNIQEKDKLFINRELSWLEFNRRVLDLAKEKTVPLGEQLNFAAIYGSNLDEFFMVRVGSLYDRTLLKSELKENKTNMTPQQQLTAIMPKVAEMQAVCDKYVAKLYTNLNSYGIKKLDFNNLDKADEAFWKKYFIRELFPLLSPQIVDRRHPFPFLRDREIYVCAMIKDEKNKNPLLGLIPVSGHFERLITIAKDGEIMFAVVEELILKFAELAFGKSTVQEKSIFRITRNADIDVEEGMFDHDIDYREIMSELLKKRRKLAPVRLQFMGTKPVPLIESFIISKIELPQEQCFIQKAPLELSILRGLSSCLKRLDNHERFFYPEKRPLQQVHGYDLYKEVKNRDVLLCYPYHSIRPFIKMLNDAARDPDVLSIKMTLYRVATDSKIIAALIAAAENGKEVVTVVELRARFDEQNNIDWSRQLEEAGCTVIYGFSDYKVHSKLTLITRKTGTKFEYISSIGTGNYNEKTSELYTDLAYFTSKEEIGEEVAAVFNNLAVERLTQNVEKLIVAPLCFKSVLLSEMDKEIEYCKNGGKGNICIKCNSISDRDIIEKLSEASSAGVKTDMIVRGICCLQSGLEGVSDNIVVRSIVGRYLEHSRIYAFGEKERLRIYIASGDFLTRNTIRRVEVGVIIEDELSKKMLWDLLELELKDNINAKVMRPDGSYAKVPKRKEHGIIDSQMLLYDYFEEYIEEDRQRLREAQKHKDDSVIDSRGVVRKLNKEKKLTQETLKLKRTRKRRRIKKRR